MKIPHAIHVYAMGTVLLAGVSTYCIRTRTGSTGLVAQPRGLVRRSALEINPIPSSRPAVHDNDLRRVLRLVRPRWHAPKVNHLLHALRLWGVRSEFTEDLDNPYVSGTPSGERMLQLMLDVPLAEEAGVQPGPFLHRTSTGVAAQYGSSGGGVAHHDQYLKVMGELGLPASTPVRLSDGTVASLEDLILDSLSHFDLRQELEFTAVAYSRWLPPAKEWFDRTGTRHTFDELTEAVLSRSPGETACFGVHTLYALVNLLRAHLASQILSPGTARRVEARLLESSRQLERVQDEGGLWFGLWYRSDQATAEDDWSHQAVVATGHHLEWIALAPVHLRPDEDVIARAERALADLIPRHSQRTISNSYPPFSHAARGLAFLAGRDQGALVSDEEVGRVPAD